MTTVDPSTLPYRPGAGVMLVNRQGKVFVAQRLDSTLEAWQMPQGGLDEGEEPRDGALRELEEETGIPRDKVEVLAAARWAAASPAELGRQATGLVPCGDSAGGNLAIVVTLALRDEPAAAPVLAQWPIYPAADPAKRYPSYDAFADGYLLSRDSMEWFDECYRADKRDWRNSPLVKDQAGMPPTLVTTAGLDPIRDQGRVYAAALAKAGVDTIYLEARGTIHGFMNLRKAIPSTDQDIARSVAALKLLLAGS